MQGRGVTQYDSNKTSHDISTATTQFDEELMKRKIVTAEQVYLAKGAKTLEEAQRLANERREQRTTQPKQVYDINANNRAPQNEKDDDSDGSDDDDDEYDDLLLDAAGDDAFFARYREERLKQLKQEDAVKKQQSQQNHMPTRIQREDWSIRVNQASQKNWVLVILWDDSSMREQDILQDLVRLQREREHSDGAQEQEEEDDDDDLDSEDGHNKRASNRIEIVTIDFQQANPHWPSRRVPAIFAYRNGTKQYEWVTHEAGKFPAREQLQVMLFEWGI